MKVAKDRLHRERLAAFRDVRGIRIEDSLLVTEEGHENLTDGIPKTITAVESAMQASGLPQAT